MATTAPFLGSSGLKIWGKYCSSFIFSSINTVRGYFSLNQITSKDRKRVNFIEHTEWDCWQGPEDFRWLKLSSTNPVLLCALEWILSFYTAKGQFGPWILGNLGTDTLDYIRS